MSDIDAVDEALLRRAIEVAHRSRSHGNHPFGALLVDGEGTVVLEAENTVTTERDVTGHAETNLVRLASSRFGAEELAEFSLYTSTEPCAMCSGAIYWAGIGRVVYALSEEGLLGLTGSNPENPTMALPCRDVFAAGQRPITVVGPSIQDAAALPHEGFWR
jgi:tRNA(Arg) A34 adenosine deaminase TadA